MSIIYIPPNLYIYIYMNDMAVTITMTIPITNILKNLYNFNEVVNLTFHRFSPITFSTTLNTCSYRYQT